MSKKLTTQEWVDKALSIHNNLYDYSLANYIGARKEIQIICKQHGDFWQRADAHLSGQGCKKCQYETYSKNMKDSLTVFIEKAKLVHGDKYEYPDQEYVDQKTYLRIVCSKHGEFTQRPDHHLQGSGCQTCKSSKGELLIRNYLKDNFKDLIFIEQYRTDWLEKLSYDFYIPDLQIAIEFQGEQHYRSVDLWGGEEGFKKRLERDVKKKIISEENDIILLEVCYNNIMEDMKKINKEIQTVIDSKGFKL